MNTAVASGKGGTGKTSVCAALASLWPQPLHIIDLDVEEPNLHLFLHPKLTQTRTAYMEVPLVDEEKCNFCGACAELCQFKAITVLGEVILTFNEMCHGCGGCRAVCPQGAVSYGQRELGTVQSGWVDDKRFIMGTLRVGEAMSPPLMGHVFEELKKEQQNFKGDVLMDCPPGVSCPAVTAVTPSDRILLVGEPTPFGFHDFRLAHQAFKPLGKPMAAVINRYGSGDEVMEEYCRQEGIPVLARIPFDRQAAQAYASGGLISQGSPRLLQAFEELVKKLQQWNPQETESEHA